MPVRPDGGPVLPDGGPVLPDPAQPVEYAAVMRSSFECGCFVISRYVNLTCPFHPSKSVIRIAKEAI